MSWQEFSSRVLMQPQDCSATSTSPSPLRQLIQQYIAHAPKEFDWRERGVVSPVKNQGHCGSCWTFSTTGALEAHHAIKYGVWRSPTLSEQQLLDCAGAFDNKGCSGGLPSHAFEYISYAGGISEEFAYPYEARSNGTVCRFDATSNNATVGAKVITSFNITQGDEDSIMYHLLKNGPVSVAFQVTPEFRKYKSGVFSNGTACKGGPMDVNHAVLVVGYGHHNDDGPFWVVKNSWSKLWGEEGYFRIRRGENMCGIAVCASYPVLN
ncbi:hypothetical protein CEUSTIGMA_g5415.t1 [Chlamydomonas eustigma]|uniref:Peptidase C1A papain C-terminal domain-containing protein n=1 Tax=Chlamydomonas eustigma TaxID=1157962 RepID=A0A250X4G8_9CHLO|nr:hypothetical protein CEUSTIGMA_g5415.t1 [Chlamydomonas eustigma]|eukprot:GAX77973.1 hypothetical protein CEUSTIGMA_g5415.t1 [Chlamydomonas eustigma]